MKKSKNRTAKQSDQAIRPLFQPPAQQRKRAGSTEENERGPEDDAHLTRSKKRKAISPQIGDKKRFKRDDQPLDSVEPLPPLLDRPATALLPIQPTPIGQTEMLSVIVDLINGDLPPCPAAPPEAIEESDWATFCPLPPLVSGALSDDFYDRPFAFFADPNSAHHVEEVVTDERTGSDPLLTVNEPTL